MYIILPILTPTENNNTDLQFPLRHLGGIGFMAQVEPSGVTPSVTKVPGMEVLDPLFHCRACFVLSNSRRIFSKHSCIVQLCCYRVPCHPFFLTTNRVFEPQIFAIWLIFCVFVGRVFEMSDLCEGLVAGTQAVLVSSPVVGGDLPDDLGCLTSRPQRRCRQRGQLGASVSVPDKADFLQIFFFSSNVRDSLITWHLKC